jgi:hypothetical protein
MKKKPSLIIIFFSLILFSCSSLKIENVKYGWGGEYFANPDENGLINIPKSSMQFSVLPILNAEKLSDKPKDFKFRIIRDEEGYFYITANKFIYVWIFKSGEASLVLHDKIKIFDGKALDDPKFNEHKPNIKLFLNDGKEFLLNKDGIIKKENNKND